MKLSRSERILEQKRKREDIKREQEGTRVTQQMVAELKAVLQLQKH